MKKIALMFLGMFLMSPLLKADSIERLSAISTGGFPKDVFPRGAYLYVADRSNLVAIDISDSLNPIILCKSGGGISDATGVSIQDFLVFAYDDGADLFWIGDISSPDTIVFISWVDLPNTVAGPQPWGIEAVDTILYIANGEHGLQIYNIANPASPSSITTYDTPRNLSEFFVLDSLIYLADGDSMIILNISNPSSPSRVGAIETPRYCSNIYVVWPYAYCTSYNSQFGNGDDGTIEIVDVSNPAAPSIVGTIPDIRGTPRAVFVNDDYIYCAASDWWYPSKDSLECRADVEGGIRVAQGIIPDSLIVSFDTPGNPKEVFVRGNLVLVPDGDSLQILYHHKTGILEESVSGPFISSFLTYPSIFSDRVVCDLRFDYASRISVEAYDISGRMRRRIYAGPVMPGSMRFYWDGKDNNGDWVCTGTYIIRITSSGSTNVWQNRVIFWRKS